MREFTVLALDVTMPDGSVNDETIATGVYQDDGSVTWNGSPTLPALVVQDAELMCWFMATYDYPDITTGDGRWRFVMMDDVLIPF